MSFDPVQDSIQANRQTPQVPTMPELHTAPLRSLLNPTSNSGEAATATAASPVPDKRTKIADLLISPAPAPMSAPVKEKKRKRRILVKESAAKEPEQKENRSYQTLLINSRARHLKKDDGEPYWRWEVQFEFLMRLFFNDKRVFKNPYYGTKEGFDWPDHFRQIRQADGTIVESDGKQLNFFELYLITLLKSNKISRILKDRLLMDINYALNFCVICLLVNIGRLNTTVNFDYEMKSQFRTYHPIPSLQVESHPRIVERYYKVDNVAVKKRMAENEHDGADEVAGSASEGAEIGADPENFSAVRGGSGYTILTVKQLQDTPRIKSILKSINDLDTNIPQGFAEFVHGAANKGHEYPLNIVSLIFLLCAHEMGIGALFFPKESSLTEEELTHLEENKIAASSGSLFNDIWLKPELKPADKASRFLWLLYLFNETGFQIDEMLANPFNQPGSAGALEGVNRDAQIASELTSGNSYIIRKTRKLIPEFHYTDPDVKNEDPLLNDTDTADEIAFGERMKNMRLDFVKREHAAPKPSRTAASSASASASAADQSPVLEPQDDIVARAAETNGVSIAPKTAITTHSPERRPPPMVVMETGRPSTLNSDRNLRVRQVSGEQRWRKRRLGTVVSTVEAGAMDPYELMKMEESYERAFKRRRRKTLAFPIRVTQMQMENLLNSEIKSINENSKNAVTKRHRNNVYSLFMKDMFNHKIDQIQKVRMAAGNLRRLSKIDGNMFVCESEGFSKPAADTDNDDTDDESPLSQGPYDFKDFGEFKVNYFKELTRVNIMLNHRELVKLRDAGVRHDERVKRFRETTGFVDEAMKKLDG